MRHEFKVMPHAELPDTEMVEYWVDGIFKAGIYADSDGIRVVSKYMVGPKPAPGWPPAILIELAPK